MNSDQNIKEYVTSLSLMKNIQMSHGCHCNKGNSDIKWPSLNSLLDVEMVYDKFYLSYMHALFFYIDLTHLDKLMHICIR